MTSTYDDHNGYQDNDWVPGMDPLTKGQLVTLLDLLDERLAESGGRIEASQWARVVILARRGLKG